jgi:hypothetical protein
MPLTGYFPFRVLTPSLGGQKYAKAMKPLEMPSCDDRLIWDTFLSIYHLPTLVAADDLGLFSLLKRKPATADEIAEGLSLGPRATEALLGVMTSLGFLVQQAGRFCLTAVSRNFLLPESPYYWGGMLHLARDIPITGASVRDALKKDQPIGTLTADLWETPEVDPEQAKAFTQAMHSHSFPAAMGVALRGDFSGVEHVLDVGGGSGCFCIALALRYPAMRFTVAELPVVCPLAQAYVAEYGLQDRVQTIAFDMFTERWPAGHDAVFFSNIFHDWDRTRCEHLAAMSFEVLPPGGYIYLHEMILEDTKDGPCTTTSFSMNMLCFTKGKQFTAGELDGLLRSQGFVDISVTPTYAYYSLVRGKKP